MRLFLLRVFVALNEPLSDTYAGIAVGVAAILALWADAERSARSIALLGLSRLVANDRRVAAMTFSARIGRVHPARDDATSIPRLIFAVPEDAPLHPVSPFRIATTRIPALFRAQLAQVLEDEKPRPVPLRELDNARAHQVRDVFIDVADLTPQVGIVLFIFRNDASL